MTDERDEARTELEELQQKLGELEAKNTSLNEELEERSKDSDKLTQLVADPDVRELLVAKERGKDVKVLSDDDKPLDLEDMSRNELTRHIVGEVGKLFDGVLGEKLKPLGEKLEGLETSEQMRREAKAQHELRHLGEKFPDVKNYSNEMSALRSENPELSAEETYLLARMRKGDGLPTTRVAVASERPSRVAVRPGRSEKRDEPLAVGKAGFNQLLDEALERQTLE